MHELVKLDMSTLSEVRGGLVAVMLEKALQRMAADIFSAPELAEFRTVTLEIRCKPVCDGGELAHVTTEFAVKGKVPTRVASAVTLVRPNTHGIQQLMFNVDAQDSPTQGTLLEE